MPKPESGSKEYDQMYQAAKRRYWRLLPAQSWPEFWREYRDNPANWPQPKNK